MEVNMRAKYFFRYILLVTLIVAATMGCKLIENIRSTVGLASTGVAVATDFGSVVTDIGSMITEIVPPGLESTVQAGLPTMQAAITDLAPTFDAVTTQVYTSPAQAPADIPIMPGDTSAFVGSPQAISYVTSTEFKKVVDFYKTEMLNKGWKSLDTGSATSEPVPGILNVELLFEKDTRKATIIITEIPFVGQTTVVINLETK
jgi:hypothetical protein